MKIAVTGSNGMIGGLLVKKLASKGNQIVECNSDNCSVLDLAALKKAFRGVEVVVHLAAKLDEEASDLEQVNVKGTENCLEAAAENNVSQFIFMSTVGVYGSTPGVKDESAPVRPETLYERTKADAEKKVLSYQEVLPVTILRPALVVGKNAYWKSIVGIVKRGFPLVGQGKNKFQLVCVDDVVDAIRFCVGRESCYGETLIVAESEESAGTLEEVVQSMREALGMNGKVMKVPGFVGGFAAAVNSVVKFSPILKPAYLRRMTRERSYSTARLASLGWKAKCSAREGITKLVKQLEEKGEA